MSNLCQCEQSHCDHADKPCTERQAVTVRTIYGRFEMCQGCATAMPDDFLVKHSESHHPGNPCSPRCTGHPNYDHDKFQRMAERAMKEEGN